MNFKKTVFLASLSLIPLASYADTSDWSGFYLGGNLGWSIATGNFNSSITDPGDPANAAVITQLFNQYPNAYGTDFIAGAQGGYNFQINNWVLGVESNYDYQPSNSIQGQYNVNNSSGDADQVQNTVAPLWFFTLRPRVGYALDHFLLYTTGGLAVTRVSNYGVSEAAGGVTNFSGGLATLAGGAVGGGVAWRITPAHWSLDAEYLWAGFEKVTAKNYTNPGYPIGANNQVATTLNFSTSIVTLGLDYHF